MRYLRIASAVLLLVLLGLWLAYRHEARSLSASTRGSGGIAAVSASPGLGTRLAGLFQKVPEKAPPPREAGYAESPPAPGPSKLSPVSSLKLIRSAEIAIELASYEDGARAADAIARSFGGYVAEARSSQTSGGPAGGSLSVRVPAGRFDEARRRLSGLGRIKTRQIHTADVTKAYFDLETRLRVERDAETRLRDVLRNRTAKLSEIVEAERELTRVVAEIEQTEGERLYYDRQVAFSTIALELAEPGIAPSPIAEPSALQPIRDAIHESVFLLASSAAGLIYALAAGLPWAGVAVLLWALIRRVRSRRTIRVVA